MSNYTALHFLKSHLAKTLLSASIALVLATSVNAKSTTADEVLVTVEGLTVTGKDLEEALRSTPFYTQFNAMNEDQQADLRGNVLKRLVTSRLLSLEAKEQKIADSDEFKQEVDNFRKGLLYRYYMDKLKAKIKIPDEKLAELQKEFKDTPDALTAAKSSYITEQYRGLYKLTIKSLRDKYHVTLFENKVAVDAKPDTVLLQGDNGIKITMADIHEQTSGAEDEKLTKEQLLEKIYQLAELLVVAKAAEDEGVDISAQVASFTKERLPAIVMEKQQDKWASDEATLKAYFDSHPNASFIPQRWHLGMIVLKTEEEANAVLERINKGESLFTLAGELSIDPYGKEHNGDMGWVRERSGNPVIENAIKDLEDGKHSGVIKTEKGYIIASIIDRRPGGKRHFESMKDKIRQLVINDHMHDYLAELQKKHKVTWKMLEIKADKPSS